MINKLDRERADFERALESVQANFGRAAVPIQIPIGAERDFTGVVDLVRMKAYTYTADGDGKGKEGDIPAELADAAQKAHEALVEMVAEGNDALMEEFFDKGTLAPGRSSTVCKQGMSEMRIFPVMCASGAAQYRHRSDSQFHRGKPARPGGARGRPGHWSTAQEATRKIAENGQCSLYVFKTTADPFAGASPISRSLPEW